jgi:hypothetical protein
MYSLEWRVLTVVVGPEQFRRHLRLRQRSSCPRVAFRVKSIMDRPCFLVVDHEYPGDISTRKLVIESAKFNVITAYDADEAITCLKRFSKVDGVVINAEMGNDEECRGLIENLRKVVPKLEIVVTSAGGYTTSTVSIRNNSSAACSHYGRRQPPKSPQENLR